MWLSLAIKIMALSTQLHWSTFHTHKICTSEQNWPSSWTCLCLGARCYTRASTVAQKEALAIGAGACRGPLHARRGAKSIG